MDCRMKLSRFRSPRLGEGNGMPWKTMESDCLSHVGLVLPCKAEKRSRRTSSWKTFSWIIVGKIHFCMWRPMAAAHFDYNSALMY